MFRIEITSKVNIVFMDYPRSGSTEGLRKMVFAAGGTGSLLVMSGKHA